MIYTYKIQERHQPMRCPHLSFPFSTSIYPLALLKNSKTTTNHENPSAGKKIQKKTMRRSFIFDISCLPSQ